MTGYSNRVPVRERLRTAEKIQEHLEIENRKLVKRLAEAREALRGLLNEELDILARCSGPAEERLPMADHFRMKFKNARAVLAKEGA